MGPAREATKVTAKKGAPNTGTVLQGPPLSRMAGSHFFVRSYQNDGQRRRRKRINHIITALPPILTDD